MTNIDRLNERRNKIWLVKLDEDIRNMANEILKAREKNGLSSPRGKNADTYKDIFKAAFRDKDLLVKLKTWEFSKDKNGK